MVAPARNALRSMGLNVLGGVSAFFVAQGIALGAESFLAVSQSMATAIFVTTYSGMVVVFVFRVWEDTKVLTENLRIVIITNDQEELLEGETSTARQIQPTLFDQETYEAFKSLLGSLPREYTVVKLNRLYFLDKLASFPNVKMQELIRDQKAFSQLLGCLKSDNFVRTDGFSFSIQPGMWEARRQELKADSEEFGRWQQVAGELTGSRLN